MNPKDREDDETRSFRDQIRADIRGREPDNGTASETDSRSGDNGETEEAGANRKNSASGDVVSDEYTDGWVDPEEAQREDNEFQRRQKNRPMAITVSVLVIALATVIAATVINHTEADASITEAEADQMAQGSTDMEAVQVSSASAASASVQKDSAAVGAETTGTSESAETQAKESAASGSGETVSSSENQNPGLSTEEEYAWVQAHENLYPEDKVPFAEGNEGLIHFMYNYGRNITPEVGDTGLTKDETSGGIPFFYQWDDRWGFHQYGTDVMGFDGCGPTSLAMVIVGLTGNPAATPAAVASYAETNGYYVSGEGTSWALFTDGCRDWGVQADEIGTEQSSIEETLRSGSPVICSVGPGYFTYYGHIMVLSGLDSEGKIIIHDPNNRNNSSRSFSYDEIADQLRACWAYSTL